MAFRHLSHPLAALTAPSHGSRRRPCGSVLTLLLTLAPCAGAVQITVQRSAEDPAGPLQGGHRYRFRALADGQPGHPCTWTVLEGDRVLGPRDDVRLEGTDDGQVWFRPPEDDRPRDYRLVATSSKLPDTRGETVVPVGPGQRPRWFWDTPFTPCFEGKPLKVIDLAWDRGTSTLVALACREREDGRWDPSILVRIRLDGTWGMLAQSGPEAGLEPRTKARVPVKMDCCGLAVLPDGRIALADTRHSQVLVWSPGKLTRLAGIGFPGPVRDSPIFAVPAPALDSGLSKPASLLATDQGEVLVLDLDQDRICSVAKGGGPDRTLRTLAGGLPGQGGEPELARTADGRILAAPAWGSSIATLDDKGGFQAFAGVPGLVWSDPMVPGKASEARIGRPRTVAATAEGKVFFFEGYHHQVGMVTPAGRLLVVAGAGPKPESRKPLPRPVAAAQVPPIQERWSRLVPAPGGGLFVLENERICFLGPGRGEADLAGLVQASAEAWAQGDGGALAARTRKSLEARARLVRKDPEQAELELKAVTQKPMPRLPGLPAALEGQACGFLSGAEENLGRAILARVGLHALGQLVPEGKAGPGAPAAKRSRTAGGEGKADAGGGSASSGSSSSSSSSPLASAAPAAGDPGDGKGTPGQVPAPGDGQ